MCSTEMCTSNINAQSDTTEKRQFFHPQTLRSWIYIGFTIYWILKLVILLQFNVSDCLISITYTLLLKKHVITCFCFKTHGGCHFFFALSLLTTLVQKNHGASSDLSIFFAAVHQMSELHDPHSSFLPPSLNQKKDFFLKRK